VSCPEAAVENEGSVGPNEHGDRARAARRPRVSWRVDRDVGAHRDGVPAVPVGRFYPGVNIAISWIFVKMSLWLEISQLKQKKIDESITFEKKLILFFKYIFFVANAFISFNTQTMHIKSFYTQQHCYVSLKTLYPGRIRTRVFSFLRRMRWKKIDS
jgi:hypothetical protein